MKYATESTGEGSNKLGVAFRVLSLSILHWFGVNLELVSRKLKAFAAHVIHRQLSLRDHRGDGEHQVQRVGVGHSVAVRWQSSDVLEDQSIRSLKGSARQC